MLGKIFNERYKIIRELGKGGMAIVFEAKDLFLDRKVALKMLRPEYVNDKDFARRFRQEAKAVARLSHPNVVNIFDIAKDGEVHYLVMEDIEGSNLKNIIQERGKLPVAEALDIANQICAALVVAHKNNIIHCDIKPANILLTTDHQVKVTDFGIARAASSATMTITDTIVGSAHYFSPEQARGGEIKTHSDLYSLGIVLYEMLTGEVPFKGDSPIAVALKHIQEKPQKPSLINPDIPPEVEKLVLKAIAKEAAARFSDAAELRESITGILKGLNREELAQGEFIPVDDGDTKVMKKVGPTNHRRQLLSEPRRLSEQAQAGKSPAWMKWTLLAMLVGLITVVSLIIFYQSYMDVPVVPVPDVVGMDFQEAKKAAAQYGLHLEKQSEVHHAEITEGYIISQFPLGGERVRQTRDIMVTISKGPAVMPAPDLINLKLREAEVILDNQNLQIGDLTYQFDENIAEGQVISQDPVPGEELSIEAKINLVISKGAQPVMVLVPNVIGLERGEALRQIVANDLRVGQVKEEMTRRFISNQVVRQQYQPGTELAEGSTVDLTISLGLINTGGAEVHSVLFRVQAVPPGPYEQQIQIYVTDNNGRDNLYNQIHQPGDYIAVTVNSVGPTTYEVYTNGELYAKEKIGF